MSTYGVAPSTAPAVGVADLIEGLRSLDAHPYFSVKQAETIRGAIRAMIDLQREVDELKATRLEMTRALAHAQREQHHNGRRADRAEAALFQLGVEVVR